MRFLPIKTYLVQLKAASRGDVIILRINKLPKTIAGEQPAQNYYHGTDWDLPSTAAALDLFTPALHQNQHSPSDGKLSFSMANGQFCLVEGTLIPTFSCCCSSMYSLPSGYTPLKYSSIPKKCPGTE